MCSHRRERWVLFRTAYTATRSMTLTSSTEAREAARKPPTLGQKRGEDEKEISRRGQNICAGLELQPRGTQRARRALVCIGKGSSSSGGGARRAHWSSRQQAGASTRPLWRGIRDIGPVQSAKVRTPKSTSGGWQGSGVAELGEGAQRPGPMSYKACRQS